MNARRRVSNGSLMPHPRLVMAARAGRLGRIQGWPHLVEATRRVLKDADACLAGTTFEYQATRHNAHLIRARIMQNRIVTLLAAWTLTGGARYRQAAMAHVRQMGRWKYWSWILWRQGDSDPAHIFDLSYGENSTTLAIAWDWMYPTLTAAEKAECVRIARRWPVAAFLSLDKAKRLWWFGKKDCNWNTVCAGGLGMLVMAMREELPEAKRILARVEISIRAYMRYLDSIQGGWPEGIGYWGYGMRYAFLYLLSWERAFGREHPMMQLSGSRRTMDFPLDFIPHGVPCSFGDVNRYWVHPFHYALAERFNRPDVTARLDRIWMAGKRTTEQGRASWPADVELLLFHARTRGGRLATKRRLAKHYGSLDWYILADRWPDPGLYLSIRGGTTEVPHNHLDLTSFHCVVGDEGLLTSLGPVEYLDTTFSKRRWEIHEMGAHSKNVILINGVGIERPSTVRSQALRVRGFPAVRLDATEAMGGMRDGMTARFYGRLFVLLDDAAALIVDHIRLRHYGRAEARFHTLGRVRVGPAHAMVAGERQKLALRFASTVPCLVREAADAMTSPGPEPRMIRWCTRDLHHEMTFVTLLVPGGKGGRVGVTSDRGCLDVQVAVAGQTRRFRLTPELRPRM